MGHGERNTQNSFGRKIGHVENRRHCVLDYFACPENRCREKGSEVGKSSSRSIGLQTLHLAGLAAAACCAKESRGNNMD